MDVSFRNSSCGIGIFAKTIGLTPLKTRLAKGIGVEKAHEFYRQSCAAIEEVMLALPAVNAYWAVAEGAQAYPKWNTGIGLMEQGTGELGERLDYVYLELRKKYQFAALMGADAPQLSPSLFNEALELAQDGSFIVGPSRDGGFYLLMGSRPIPKDIWQKVPYSQQNTADRLCSELSSIAPVHYLRELGDVDHQSDLSSLLEDLKVLSQPFPKQESLRQWLCHQL